MSELPVVFAFPWVLVSLSKWLVTSFSFMSCGKYLNKRTHKKILNKSLFRCAEDGLNGKCMEGLRRD